MSGVVSTYVNTDSTPKLDFFSDSFGFNKEDSFDFRYQYAVWDTVSPLASKSDNLRFIMNTSFGPVTPCIDRLILACNVNLTKKSDKNAVVDQDTKLGPVNNLLHSLFKSIKVYFNNCQVLNISHYGYFAYLQTKLSSSLDDLDTFLKAACYFEDSADHFDDFDDNEGIQERRNMFGQKQGNNFVFSKSQKLLVGQLILPLPKLYIPHPCQIIVDLETQNQNWLLQAEGENMDAQLNLNKLELKHVTYTLNDLIFNDVTKRLNESSMRYLFESVDTEIHSLPPNSETYSIDTIARGKIISSLIVVRVLL